jgi:hypothetical protein
LGLRRAENGSASNADFLRCAARTVEQQRPKFVSRSDRFVALGTMRKAFRTDPPTPARQPRALCLAFAALAAGTAFALGCSSGDDGSAATGGSAGASGAAGAGAAAGSTGAGGAAGAAGSNALLGGFTITMVAEAPASGTVAAIPAHTTLIGKVYDGAYPETTRWTAVESSGGCELSTPSVPYCSPNCANGMACVGTGTCATYPTSQNVGTVSVTGLGANFSLEAGPSNTYQPDATVQFAYPPFTEGASVQIDAAGGTLEHFILQGKGIAPLVLSGTGAYALATGSPLALAWTAPGAAIGSRVKVHLDISHHGGSKGRIECDVDDTGSLSIPASLITKLVNLGVAGFPTVSVSRVFSSEATIPPGKVSLTITAPIERAVTVPGVESCTTDTECTAPKTCQDDLTCG